MPWKQLSYLSLHLSGELRSATKPLEKRSWLPSKAVSSVVCGGVSLNNIAFELSDLLRPETV